MTRQKQALEYRNPWVLCASDPGCKSCKQGKSIMKEHGISFELISRKSRNGRTITRVKVHREGINGTD